MQVLVLEILHTIWDSNNIHFLVETLEDVYEKPHQNFVRKLISNDNLTTRTVSQIVKILKIIGFEGRDQKIFQISNLNLYLPEQENNQISFSETFSEVNSNEFKLKRYSVDTITFTPIEVMDFLLEQDSSKYNFLKFSDSTEYWSDVTKYVLNLISKEKFLPYIHIVSKNSDTTSFIGKWKASIDSREKAQFLDLIHSLPIYYKNMIKCDLPESELVKNFIDQMIDGFVRNKLHVHLPQREIIIDKDEISNLTRKWFESLFINTTTPIIVKTSLFNLFSGIIKSWLNSATQPLLEKQFRTCFKLDPPEEGEKEWKIRFFLQSEKDLSLLIPAEKIWNYSSNTLEFLTEKFENPQERLLIDLAKASIFYPKIEDCFKSQFPIDIPLTKREAFLFLENTAPILETNDFSLLLPAWWKNPVEKIRLRANLSNEYNSTSDSLFKLNEFLKFEWEVAIGDSSLSIEEFERLSELKIPFVRLRGKWIRFDSNEVQDIIEKVKSNYNQITFGEALHLSLLEDLERNNSLDLEINDNGLFDSIKTKFGSSSTIVKIDTPVKFNGILRHYQIDGFSWINYLKDFGFGACLADDMGLGKTIQIIAFLQYEIEQSKNDLPSLLICPTSIVGNWFKEIKRFAPNLKAYIYHGSNRPNKTDFENIVRDYDLIITTYNLAQRDKNTLSTISWENLILDEAQNIKNPQAKQTRAIKNLVSVYRIALTGTPIENRLSEVWSIMDFLNPGYLGSLKEFNDKFVTTIEKDFNSTKREELARIIQPFILRRLKTDPSIIQDLPEKIENNIYCSLKEEQAILYEAIVKDLFNQLNEAEGIQRKGLVLATITKLKQICNHPAQFMHEKKLKLDGRSCKFERLEEMLQEILENNEKALIFTQYKELGTLLQKYLEKKLNCNLLFLSGDTPQKSRDEMVRNFQSNDGPKLFILSIKAGGVGLNLTAANHVFHIDRWWNPAVENQATDRAFRIGQEKNVIVHKFVCIGTLEESIDQLIEQKKELAGSIISTGDAWLTELSTEDLRNVLSLRAVL